MIKQTSPLISRCKRYSIQWSFFSFLVLAGTLFGLAVSPALADVPPLGTDAAQSITLSKPVSLSEVLQWAEEQNRELQEAHKNLDLARIDIKIAKRFPNPQYTGIYTWGRLYTTLSYPQQFGFNQLIETAGKRRKRTDVAQAQSRLTELQYNALRWDIRSQVRQAYAEVLAAEQNATMVDAQAALLDRLVDIARKRVDAGAAPGTELFQAQLARHQVNTQKNEASGRVGQAKASLNGLLDDYLPPNFEISDVGLFQAPAVKTEIAPPPSITLPEAAQLYQQAYQGRADLKALEQEQVVAQNQLRLARAQRIPDVQLLAGYQYAITPSTFYGSRFFGGPNIGTTVELPLLHNHGAEIARIKTLMSQNDLRIQNLRHQIKLDINAAHLRLHTAHQNLQLFETGLIPEAKKVLYLAERSYQVGKTPLANVIIAQQSFQQIISDFTQTVINYQNAWGDLEKAVGSPLSAW